MDRARKPPGASPSRCGLIALLALLLGAFQISSAPDATGAQPYKIVTNSVMGEFNQVWEDLLQALSDKGLVVSSISNLDDMLKRTEAAFDDKRQVYSGAKVLGFCSAILARKLFAADENAAIFCPFKISVYSLTRSPGRVHLSYQKFGGKSGARGAALAEVDQLLDGLVMATVNLQKQFE